MNTTLALLLAAAFALHSIPGAAWAGPGEEAERQIAFAQDELAAGDFDRALRSAESALRLDPTRLDSILLKARAYEGLGNLELAESLVLAYGEFVGGLDSRPEAQAVLQRIRAARDTKKKLPRDRVVQARRRIVPVPVPLEAPKKVDVGPYRDRVVAALAEGRCNAASSAATELTLTAPDVADGWKLVADAHRCRGDLRAALLGYRRYQREGGDEASALALIDRLEGKYGALLVQVDAPAQALPIRARITLDGEDLLAEPTPKGARRLRDLPVGEAFTLTVSGRGLRPVEVQLGPLTPGEVREIAVSPEWLGLATVRMAAFDDATRVVLFTEDSEVVAASGKPFEISAASAWALVENEHGVQSVPLAVQPDAELEFDPAPFLPSRLAVAGVPAGAMVTVEVTADDGRRGGWTEVLPYDVGEIDLETGVRIAPVRSFDSLPGGVGTVHVEHPTLGEGTIEVVLETGAVNAVTFAWRPLPGVKLVAERYEEWKGQRDVALGGERRTMALGVVSGVLAGIGGGLLVGALVTEGEVDAARDRAVAAHDARDSAALTSAIADFKAARDRGQALGIAAGVGFGLSGIGWTVTIVSGGVARAGAAESGEWAGYGD